MADASVCLLRLIVIVQLFPPLDTIREYNELFCRTPAFIDFWAKYSSIALTSAIAVDRYLAICKPHGTRLTVRRAWYIVAGCYASTLLIGISYAFFYGVVVQEDGSSRCSFVVAEWITNTMFIFLVLTFLVSFVLVVVLYTKMYRAIRRMAKTRPGNTVARGAFNRKTHDESTALAEGGRYSQSLATVSGRTISSGPEQKVKQESMNGDTAEPKASPSIFLEAGPDDNKKQQQQGKTSETPLLSLAQAAQTSGTSSTRNGANAQGSAPDDEPSKDGGAGANFHRKTTLMLLLSTVMYLATLMPLCVILALYPVIIPALAYSPGLRFFVNVASYIHFINNAANPILFCFVNRKFRMDMANSVRSLSRCRFVQRT